MYTLEELKKLDSKKILDEIRTVEKELFKTKFEVQSGQGKANHLIKVKRKYIAQMKTTLNAAQPKAGAEPLAQAPKSPKTTN